MSAEVPHRLGQSLESRLLRRLLSHLGNPPIEIVLNWTGERLAPQGRSPIGCLRIADRRTLLSIMGDPQVRIGDAYSAGRVNIDGDLVLLMRSLYGSTSGRDGSSSIWRHLTPWHRRPRRNTLVGSRSNIHRHYDIGNDFYALWLGETMIYTCAYYPSKEATLDQAQIAKMDHICRKLRIRAGESVIDAGCGWGGLALHMASRYGARVRAFSISREQIDYARQRARVQGLDGRVEFIEDDYRNISGKHDAFVSVGMLEHIGVENYAVFGHVVRRLLTAEGRGLIHSIGRNHPEPTHPWIEQRIFPGAYLPSLAEMMHVFETTGLSVLDVENIRLHYARTLRHWIERYEAAADRVRAMFDETFVRMWRLYLAGSAAAFEVGQLQLFHVLFTTRENNNIPFNRQYMYAADVL
jgi:cyclopropane-fatty-acyl-phospholipid synthase